MSIRQDIGIVTAYGYAVSKGYQGTEEEFAEAMAAVGTNVDEITDAIDTFINQTVPAATQAVTDEGIEQVGRVTAAGTAQVNAVEEKGTIEIGAVNAAGTTQVAAVNSAGSTQLTAINTAGSTQVSAVNSAGTTQTAAVNAAGATQTGNVNTAGATQIAAIEAKGEEVIESIPEDYTDLVNEVDDIIDALPEGNASGNPVAVDDAAAFNAKNLVVTLEPVQPGSGDPSPTNIRPIYPHTQAKVQRSGKNLIPMTVEGIKNENSLYQWNGNSCVQTGITITIQTDDDENVVGIKFDGTATNNLYCHVSIADFENLLGEQITLNGCPANGSNSTYQLMYYVYDGSVNAQDFGNGVTFTPTNNSFVQIVIRSGVTVNGLVFKPMIRLASETDATFEPYQGQDAVMSFNQDVYGEGDDK